MSYLFYGLASVIIGTSWGVHAGGVDEDPSVTPPKSERIRRTYSVGTGPGTRVFIPLDINERSQPMGKNDMVFSQDIGACYPKAPKKKPKTCQIQ